MLNGIALYPGLDNSEEENLLLLKTAANIGEQKSFFIAMRLWFKRDD